MIVANDKKSVSRPRDRQDFINRSNILHSSAYNYDKVLYSSYSSKVIVNCKEHGDFKVSPYKHLQGVGCPTCNYKSKDDKFTVKARNKHGDRYNYDKVVYKGCYENVTITCHQHGDFEQTPIHHLQGYGCPKCGKNKGYHKFINKCKSIYDSKYIYDKVSCINRNKTDLIVGCPEHGYFTTTVYKHLKGYGCPVCGNKKRDEFIKEARDKHGNKYNYDKVIYTKAQEKIIITCPEHGDFEQTPSSHKNGTGCPRCGKTGKFSTDDFRRISREKHGDRYNYDKTVYTGSYKDVTINCKEHGDFTTVAYYHMIGSGVCPICSQRVSNQESFIKKARDRHGDRYGYDKVVYKGSADKVIINCRVHGNFEQTPSAHLNSNGCPKCSGLIRLTNEQFVNRSKSVHGDRYDYSMVDYKNAMSKVDIICKEHGVFRQTPNTHLAGSGCPKCTKRFTKEKFIKKATIKHGGKYNYDKVVYTNYFSNIIITCKEHGDFVMNPQQHMKGNGCKKCKHNSKLK